MNVTNVAKANERKKSTKKNKWKKIYQYKM